MGKSELDYKYSRNSTCTLKTSSGAIIAKFTLLTYINNNFLYSLGSMQRIISLKPISSSSISPQRQKRIRAERSSALTHHSLKLSSPPPQHINLFSKDEITPIPVSDTLRQLLVNKNLQGFIKIAEAEPHPCVADLLQEIDVSKITNK